MKYKAVVGFSGTISAAKGDVLEIADKAISEDLLEAGYIESIEEHKNESKRTKSKSDM